MDIYRGKLKAEKHFGRYALFVSFFPQLVAGPIERSTNLLPQFREKHKFEFSRMREGLLLMLWGLFKKIVIADRLAVVVNNVYNSPSSYQGFELVIATVFFAIQIYCDFAGYSDIAIGCAKVMGFELMENFERPYFSKSIAEFWRRWHISLSSWFKDYLYFPLGGSRVVKWKKYRNIIIVFSVSGLWHGASWNFVIWGFLNGMYQIIGMELKPYREKLINVFKINRDSFVYKLTTVLITFTLVDFAWIFFRANTFQDAIKIIRNIFVFNPEILFNGSLYELGLDKFDFNLSIIVIIILFIVELLQRSMNIRTRLLKEPLIARWLIYWAIIFATIILGAYGNYDASQFIYFQF